MPEQGWYLIAIAPLAAVVLTFVYYAIKLMPEHLQASSHIRADAVKHDQLHRERVLSLENERLKIERGGNEGK